MAEPNSNAVRAIAWKEIFPWLMIFKTFRLATGFRALAMSAAAALLTVFGWYLFGHGVAPDDSSVNWLQPFAESPWTQVTGMVPDKPDFFGSGHEGNAAQKISHAETNLSQQSKVPGTYEPQTGAWSFLSQPLWKGFGLETTFGNLLRLICCGLWSLAVWSFFGAAITRIAAVQLAANERITWGSSLCYACSKFFAYFFAPLFPLLVIAVCTIPALLAAWLLRFDSVAILMALAWPVLLICGLAITLLLIGLSFGWPLMWPTISTEGSDSFDALSRSYAAVYQRPLNYLFYVVVAAVLGILGWIFVKNFAAAIIWSTYWAASWNAGAQRIEDLRTYHDLGGHALTGMAYAAAKVIHFWTGLAKLLAVGFIFSYFWNAFAAIYLLLRRDVDATELDEVFLDADEGEAKFGLPKIILDDAGAPEVQEPAAAKPEEQPTPATEKVAEKTPDLATPTDDGPQPETLV